MKKFQVLALTALMTVSAQAYDGIDKLSLSDKPELYSKLYQQLSEEDRVTLFEAQKRNMDQGLAPFDPTVACSRWVTIGTVIRQSVSANLGGVTIGSVIHNGDDVTYPAENELYFDIEDNSVFEGLDLE